jgi:hypothetical protein
MGDMDYLITLSELRELHRDDPPNKPREERPVIVERYKTLYRECANERADRMQEAEEVFREDVENLYKSAENLGLIDIEGHAPWQDGYEITRPDGLIGLMEEE